ncbi:GNAT family N-acetyltransferase [Dyadobacter luteus]|uniref:GNAT family N-acetyltransferase n=1 Tax=Dyadobacter luteus TaxID=2259619 RepID=A0A3D8YDL7_9BACT|nr:GNAT family N-acetyltransferase [Dyadobacter luteus]REA62657.1 GNAT family N-acetyltransferase [Dyadobacter luteus]
MKQYTIEPASVKDYPRLLSIWEAAVRATHDFLQEEHITFYKQQIPGLYFPAVSLFIARGDDKDIAGFLGLTADNIEMLFVDPIHFGKGIGKQLTQFAIAEKGIRKVDVNEQNPQALGFYQRMGFIISSRSQTDAENNPFPILHLELERD